MEKDIVVEVAKRTAHEVLNQIKDTPFAVMPAAMTGLLLISWTGLAIMVVLIFAFVAYDQYNEIISEIETSIKEAAYAQKPVEAEVTEVVTPAEPVAQADADVTKVSEETK